jgi:glycosyltransferase involved in cell wall biosynthesis
MTRRPATPRCPHLALVTGNPLRIGGMQTFTRFLVETACSAGWRVTVGLSGEDIYGDIGGRLEVERVEWIDGDLAGDRRYRRQTIMDRRRWFRRVRPDVVLFVQSSNTPFRAAVVGATLAGVPVVVTHRTMPWVRDFVPVGRHLMGLVPGFGLHNRRQVFKAWVAAILADRIVYNSRFVREQYESIYAYPRRKGCVIVNAAPSAGCVPPRAQSPGPVTIGYLGRLADEKRVDVLIQGLAQMRHRGAARLLIFGEGSLRESLIKQAVQAGVAGQVEFRNSTFDTASAYAEIDIVAVCSRRESSSNTVLEAMAAGRAVVVSDVGGLPELIDKGRAGIIVPVGDAAALAGALDRLVSDPDERFRFGEKAQAVARERHDGQRIGRHWLRLLAEVAARRVGPRIASLSESDAEAIAFPG